jgi:hypothetical protein
MENKIQKVFFLVLSGFFKGNTAVRVKEIDSFEEHRDLLGIQFPYSIFRIGSGETVSF